LIIAASMLLVILVQLLLRVSADFYLSEDFTILTTQIPAIPSGYAAFSHHSLMGVQELPAIPQIPVETLHFSEFADKYECLIEHTFPDSQWKLSVQDKEIEVKEVLPLGDRVLPLPLPTSEDMSKELIYNVISNGLLLTIPKIKQHKRPALTLTPSSSTATPVKQEQTPASQKAAVNRAGASSQGQSPLSPSSSKAVASKPSSEIAENWRRNFSGQTNNKDGTAVNKKSSSIADNLRNSFGNGSSTSGGVKKQQKSPRKS